MTVTQKFVRALMDAGFTKFVVNEGTTYEATMYAAYCIDDISTFVCDPHESGTIVQYEGYIPKEVLLQHYTDPEKHPIENDLYIDEDYDDEELYKATLYGNFQPIK